MKFNCRLPMQRIMIKLIKISPLAIRCKPLFDEVQNPQIIVLKKT